RWTKLLVDEGGWGWHATRTGLKGSQVRQPHKTLLLWVVLIVAFLAIWQLLNDAEGPQRQEVSYSDFMSLVKAPRDQRHIDEVEIRGRDYNFTVKNPAGKGGQEKGRPVGPTED